MGWGADEAKRKWHSEDALSPVDGDGAAIPHDVLAWNGIRGIVRIFNRVDYTNPFPVYIVVRPGPRSD